MSVRDHNYCTFGHDPIDERDIQIIPIESDIERAEMIASGKVKIGAWNCIFLREMIESNKIRFPEGLFYEDIYWGAVVHLYFKRACLINKVYYHYFVREDSTVLSDDTKKHEDFFIMQKRLWDEINSRKAITEYGQAIEFDYLMNYYIIGMKMLALRFTKVPYEFFYKMKNDIEERIPLWYRNRYIEINTSEFQKIQLNFLKYDVGHEELDRFISITKNYYEA